MARSFEEFLAAREGIADLDQYIAAAQEPFEDGLRALVEIPSVSQHADRRGDVVRCATRASEYLGTLSRAIRLGAVNAYGDSGGGLPVVHWDRFGNPKWQTVIIYNHLDVQPAKPEDGWDTDPFEFVARDDAQVGRRYFGRGTTDDKGPALTVLLAVKFAIQLGFPLNFFVIWETEEEAGSPNFPAWFGQRSIRRHLRKFASPSLLISDTIWPASNVPAVSCGLRGLINFTFELTTATDEKGRPKGVHSGLVGGAAPNPLNRLAHVIARCADEQAWVLIPDGREGLQALPREELEAFARAGAMTVERFKDDYGLRSSLARSVPDLLDRVWNLPTFEVTGMFGGITDPPDAVKTEVPGYGRAHISCRLGPGQDPVQFEQALRAYVACLDPDVVVTRRGGVGRPFAMDPEGPHLQAAAEALKAGFGYPEVVFDRCGGSIGAVTHFTDILPDLPVVLLGLSLPEHNYHGTQENFDWRQAAGGIRTFVNYFERVAKMEDR